jgi:hypothetical protein
MLEGKSRHETMRKIASLKVKERNIKESSFSLTSCGSALDLSNL